MKADKAGLLKILAGEVCPVCEKAKRPQTWACGECYRPLKAKQDYEDAAKILSDSCDIHMEAADAFLRLVKEYAA